jgi:hypothetical protein
VVIACEGAHSQLAGGVPVAAEMIDGSFEKSRNELIGGTT